MDVRRRETGSVPPSVRKRPDGIASMLVHAIGQSLGRQEHAQPPRTYSHVGQRRQHYKKLVAHRGAMQALFVEAAALTRWGRCCGRRTSPTRPACSKHWTRIVVRLRECWPGVSILMRDDSGLGQYHRQRVCPFFPRAACRMQGPPGRRSSVFEGEPPTVSRLCEGCNGLAQA